MIYKTACTALVALTLATTAMAWPNHITVSGAKISDLSTSGCLAAQKTDNHNVSVDLADMTQRHSKFPPNCLNIGYVNMTLNSGDKTCHVTFSGTDLNSPSSHVTYYCCGMNNLNITSALLNDPKHPTSEAIAIYSLTNGCKN